MGTAFIFFLFAGFITINSLIILLAPSFIPYLGFFPYGEIATQYNLTDLFTKLANFDGVHYLMIAKQGYAQYQQAFFPLYPILIDYISPLFLNNFLLTGLVISNVSFLLGLYIFSKYLKILFNNKQQSNNLPAGRQGLTISTILFLLFFPTSFFFTAVYTEGLFFLLFIGTLFFLKKDRLYLAAIFALLASLTRLIGVFLIIFFIFKLIRNLPRRQAGWKLKIRNFVLVFAAFSPLVGLVLYSLYLWQTTGDPLFFLNSQWAFGANRRSNLILLPQVYYRYFNIFITARWNFQYFISVFEFITFNFVFIILILDLIKNLKLKNSYLPAGRKNFARISLSLFSITNLLLPTFTGTFSSVPRYVLFSLSFFIFLAEIKSSPLKIVIALVFLILHIVMLGFFSQGYFIS